jgi:magnesium chelatase subunit I
MTDVYGIIPAITGKVELVYEGEQEGAGIVARNLIGKAIRTLFTQYFPDPEKSKKQKEGSVFTPVSVYFEEGRNIQLLTESPGEAYRQILDAIPGMDDLLFDSSLSILPQERLFWKEFILFGLAEFSIISKKVLESETRFSDLLSSMINLDEMDFDDE